MMQICGVKGDTDDFCAFEKKIFQQGMIYRHTIFETTINKDSITEKDIENLLNTYMDVKEEEERKKICDGKCQGIKKNGQRCSYRASYGLYCGHHRK
jgi:hypothetical protein